MFMKLHYFRISSEKGIHTPGINGLRNRWQLFTYLIQGHTEQKQHHVDDFVHHNFTLEADKEEHSSTDIDPILDEHGHHQISQNLHDVLIIIFIHFFFLFPFPRLLLFLFLSIFFFMLLFHSFLFLILLFNLSFYF